MDIAAQGGYLYAQAMEKIEHYEEKRKKCNRWTLCLTKNTEHRTYHEVKNKVTEFHAGNDINLLSYNDSIYEATKINTQRNATLTSTHGRIFFNTSRVIGGLAGALDSGTAADTYSGADAGVIAVQNNFLRVKDVMDMKKELEKADKSRTDKQVIYQNPIYSTNYY